MGQPHYVLQYSLSHLKANMLGPQRLQEERAPGPDRGLLASYTTCALPLSSLTLYPVNLATF